MTYTDWAKIMVPFVGALMLASFGLIGVLMRNAAALGGLISELRSSTGQLKECVDELWERCNRHDEKIQDLEVSHARLDSRIPPSEDRTPRHRRGS